VRSSVRVDPAFIRDVLAAVDATNTHRAAVTHGLYPRTVNRWVTRREREGPQWPTDDDITAWRRDQEQHATRRAHDAERSREYRKLVYLNRGPIQRDSRGTTRRLQALHALGWTLGEMAAELGVTGQRVSHLMNGHFPTVFPSTFDSVSALYERLCMTVPIDQDPVKRGEIRVHHRTRKRARLRGFAPPLAWDDIDNDDHPHMGPPTARGSDEIDDAIVARVLAGERIATTIAEKQLILARWMATGGTEHALCSRMGWRPGRYTPDVLEATG
jgi:hypothetical protein